MADLINAVAELKALPPSLHLLCPRPEDDDLTVYPDTYLNNPDDATTTPGTTDPEIASRVSEAAARREKFLSCLRLLAFSADESEEDGADLESANIVAGAQAWMYSSLSMGLARCDLCIRSYHRGKAWLTALLRESYDEEDVDRFVALIDEWDINRIRGHLEQAKDSLLAVPPEQRGLGCLDRAELLAVFEGLSSQALLDRIDTSSGGDVLFDEVFKLVQTRRTLKILDYVPASTRFLFDADPFRAHWAAQLWTKFMRPPTRAEFEWAIKEPLLAVLRRVLAAPLPNDDVLRLWSGMKLIIRRLDKSQITHDLRGLEIDPCRLSVDHLTVPSPALRPLLNAIQIFLEKAPADFWDAMQTISPKAIVEAVFYNPQYSRFLQEAADGDMEHMVALSDMLAWIDPFMASLRGNHQPQAARALAKQLLGELQVDLFSPMVRYRCFRAGLAVLIRTLRSFTDNEATRGNVAQVVLSDTLEVIADNIELILKPPSFGIPGSDQDILSLCMDVVRNTLALECQSLKSDYEAILANSTLSHGVSTYSVPIWDAVVRNLTEDNLPLSRAALMGILPLVGLEKFHTRINPSKEKTNFNVIYGHLTHLACQILERLSDFHSAHLDALYKSPETNCSLISALFAADLNTYQAAVTLIKTISGQPGRRESIKYLLEAFSTTTITGFGWSFRRISNMKTFSSAPRMIMTGTDIVNVLCDSEDGILRKKLGSVREAIALQKLWEYQWQALSTIFECTEHWHMMGNDRNVLLDFCRDAIQFAALLFGQYDSFVSAISEFDSEQVRPAKESLIQPLTATMSWMVKWLRLKDEYLATTLVELVLKVLHHLANLHVTIAQDALSFIEGVAVTASIRTILTNQEKAELARALEAYYGRPIATKSTEPVKAPVKKQSRITTFAKPAATIDLTNEAQTGEGNEFDEDVPDSELIALSSSVELNKARMAAESQKQHEREKKRLLTVPTKPAPPKVVPPAKNVLSFREKREREKEAKKKRDQLELAKVKKTALAKSEHTANQGSGLAGINVGITDHTPVDSMMVSTDTESEESEEDEDDLLSSRRRDSKPKAVQEYEESKRAAMKHMPVKKAKVLRSAKDMRARLAPDLTTLHRTLLSWDLLKFKGQDLPPNSDRTDYSLVSSSFSSAAEYQRTFEPLLMLEAWQSFQAVVEEWSFKSYTFTIASRLSVDAFVEVISTMAPTDIKKLGLGEADLVMLSTSNPLSDDAPRCLARISRCSKKKGQIEISYRVNTHNPLLAHLTLGREVWAVRVTSLTPMEREYGALMALQYYDLSDEIVHARPSPVLKYGPEALGPIQGTYGVNDAQAKAVKSALDNDAFTLIQGPPGSGKTKTIVALVGALMTNSLDQQNTSIQKPGSGGPATRTANSKKLLICAPSNAAVDELVMRVKQGVKTLNGRQHGISVVRVGRTDAVNANVMDVTLDELVTHRLAGALGRNKGEDSSKYYEEHKQTCNKLNDVRAQLDALRASGQEVPAELEREFTLLKQKKTQLSLAIDSARDKNVIAMRDAEFARRKAQQQIISEAHIICATLSGSGHELFSTLNVEFETVIIDEAAQSIELSALIPLKYGCSKCILVGDPKQLPPTVLSKEAARFQYEQSLFVRMQENHPGDVHLLDTQYRMHPQISKFPNFAFYDGRLKDGSDMEKLRQRPWHGSELLGPYRFFDVQGMHASAPKGHSLVNMAELKAAMMLYERLLSDYKSRYDFSGKIGIITPYKGQLNELRTQFSVRYGNAVFEDVEFNTTDAFQGRECEVIIFSCVRASNHGVGFLSDIRRMNVGLTRAKSSLWVLGNSRSLVRGEFWKKLIDDAHERNVYTQGDVVELLKKPQLPLYNDVEMTDAPVKNEQQSASTHSSPSFSMGRHAESLTTTPTNGDNPQLVPPQDGPSGGGNGLNDNAMCGFCGSNEHSTHACDNEEAQFASKGLCTRCGDSGHTRNSCTAVRCMQCGGFGHESNACQSTKPLAKREKDQIRRDERGYQNAVKNKAERQRQWQLGDHDPKIPAIHVPGPPSSSSPPDENRNKGGNTGNRDVNDGNKDENGNHNQKRKRGRDGSISAPPKVNKVQRSAPLALPGSGGPPAIPPSMKKKMDPQTFAPPPPDLVAPSKNGPVQRPVVSDPNVRPDPSASATTTNRPPANAPTGPAGANRPRAPGQPPPMRRKKPVDPFIRPKRR